jgi:hypothetical protein
MRSQIFRCTFTIEAGGSVTEASQMETQVRTPQAVFMQPQRLKVPLFQRPYVWNEDDQWEPLWCDVTRVAERLLGQPHAAHQPHFLGAVVLQQLQNPSGTMQERTIIDGQQRLTTLQLLLDALRRELQSAGAELCASRLEDLTMNARHYWARPDDRFKVWPTNRDREAFNEVMAADPPLVYADMAQRTSRLVQAHHYFAQRAREWLDADTDALQARAGALERAVRELIQIVVIDLGADENAQEIFETLNARGAQLTAADLIKNFIFQRLTETGANVEMAYAQQWKDFETAFWETEISAGRVKHQRSSVFLSQWLIAKVRKSGRDNAGDVIERYLRQQSASNWYWPDDVHVRAELRSFPAYRRLSRARARMVLEAIEDYERGWRGAESGLSGERVSRGSYSIEHILPQKWKDHWLLSEGGSDEDRDALVDTFGNLTLLTRKLNSSVSNGPWNGSDGKRRALNEHSFLFFGYC